MAQLSMYHSNTSSIKRSSFKDKHLLLIILAVFATICFGSLYFTPEVIEQVSFDVAYRKFIGLEGGTNVIVVDPDNAVMDDQVSPSQMVSDNKETVEVVHQDMEEEKQTVKIEYKDATKDDTIEQHDDHNYVNVDNKDSDPVIIQSREKVKEVSALFYIHMYVHMCIYIYIYIYIHIHTQCCKSTCGKVHGFLFKSFLHKH